MAQAEKKSLNSPDEVRPFEKGKAEIVNIAGGAVGRTTFEPGWRWSEHVKPIVKTEKCEQHHVGYTISGRARIKLPDGSEVETGPGDVFSVPPGHDAWVIGDEAWVSIDWAGMATYAKPA
jgi:quercetin dioxygenase-like cupin family protein